MNKLNPKVLVLGINGMVGRIVYAYLKSKYKNNIYGTTRNDKNTIRFQAEFINEDIPKIIKKVGKINYVINCIGINKVREDNKISAISSNALLPLFLCNLSYKYDYKLIHISTDAVFKQSSSRASEKDLPTPEGLYAITKYLGEDSCKNTINIRTSIIGLDPYEKKGLMEFVLNNKDRIIPGYINQSWSGCTTLQFAKFAEYIIYKGKFNNLRRRSYVYHFAPLGLISKHDLISEIIKTSKKKIKLRRKKNSVTITRYLSSLHFNRSLLNPYGTDVNNAIKELIEYEKEIKNEK